MKSISQDLSARIDEKFSLPPIFQAWLQSINPDSSFKNNTDAKFFEI